MENPNPQLQPDGLQPPLNMLLGTQRESVSISQNTKNQNDLINSPWQRIPSIPLWLIAAVVLVFVTVVSVQLLRGSKANFWGFILEPPQTEQKDAGNNVKSELENLKNKNIEIQNQINNLKGDTNRLIIDGKENFAGSTIKPGSRDEYYRVTFPKEFKSVPTVVVTQQVPEFHPFVNGILSIRNITKKGFDIQRINAANSDVWNDQRVTINYIAVGEK